MGDPVPEESSDTADDERNATAGETEADKRVLSSRKRISREEIFDEYGHITGYSDLGGFSNLQFVFKVEEEVDEDAADEDAANDLSAAKHDEVTDIIGRQQVTQDSASAESDKSTTNE